MTTIVAGPTAPDQTPRPYYSDDSVTLHHGDSLATLRALPDASVNCCVTSPPYFGLRDYGVAATNWPEISYSPIAGMPAVTIPAMVCCLGAELDPAAFVAHLRAVFAEVRRVLADDGTLWLNMGDSYSARWSSMRTDGNRGSRGDNDDRQRRTSNQDVPEKNLHGIPWRVAFALQDDGWIMRNDIVWHKTNAMPESVTDRLSNRHEMAFLFSKNQRYWFDLDPVREPLVTAQTPRPLGGRNLTPRHVAATDNTGWKDHDVSAHSNGRNPGDVWTIPTQPFAAAHFAVMPPALAERCVLAGCKPGGVVLDPFSGSGTTGLVATKHGRRYVGIDLSADYLDLSLRTRLAQTALIDGDAA